MAGRPANAKAWPLHITKDRRRANVIIPAPMLAVATLPTTAALRAEVDPSYDIDGAYVFKE